MWRWIKIKWQKIFGSDEPVGQLSAEDFVDLKEMLREWRRRGHRF